MLSKRGGFANYAKLAYEYFRIPKWNPLNMTNENKSLIAFNLSYLFDRMDLLKEAMQDLMQWVSEGKIRPAALQTFSFEKVADAHRALESGRTVGKLILRFDG
jgi:NADPH:quinone reductase-like Zn-dependent oxidoreductase